MEKHSLLGDVRGIGLMTGLEPVKDEKLTSASAEAESIQENCLRRGLPVGPGGTAGNVIRFQPLLVISRQQIDEAIDIFSQSLRELKR